MGRITEKTQVSMPFLFAEQFGGSGNVSGGVDLTHGKGGLEYSSTVSFGCHSQKELQFGGARDSSERQSRRLQSIREGDRGRAAIRRSKRLFGETITSLAVHTGRRSWKSCNSEEQETLRRDNHVACSPYGKEIVEELQFGGARDSSERQSRRLQSIREGDRGRAAIRTSKRLFGETITSLAVHTGRRSWKSCNSEEQETLRRDNHVACSPYGKEIVEELQFGGARDSSERQSRRLQSIREGDRGRAAIRRSKRLFGETITSLAVHTGRRLWKSCNSEEQETLRRDNHVACSPYGKEIVEELQFGGARDSSERQSRRLQSIREGDRGRAAIRRSKRLFGETITSLAVHTGRRSWKSCNSEEQDTLRRDNHVACSPYGKEIVEELQFGGARDSSERQSRCLQSIREGDRGRAAIRRSKRLFGETITSLAVHTGRRSWKSMENSNPPIQTSSDKNCLSKNTGGIPPIAIVENDNMVQISYMLNCSILSLLGGGGVSFVTKYHGGGGVVNKNTQE